MKKHILVRELVQLCDRNRDGSFSTQAARKTILIQAGKDLLATGFRNLSVQGWKPKHVVSLVERWKADGVSDATMKNRLSHLRWLAEKIGKQSIIPRTNAELGIGRRRFVTNVSKAVTVSNDTLAKIRDERLRVSIELQRAFGLRREECLKFQPSYAMAAGNDRIQLKASWCKGGRAREIPIRTDYQREVLARAAVLAGAGSMIPPDKRYVEQLKRYENVTTRAGLSKLHGLRHEYAQQRYRELTGWESPACGGPTSRHLTPEQKAADRAARLTISRELGHNREAITAVYLGR
ncbi:MULTISPECIES: phage integrase N-terminal domain-containing protein [Burkholderia]|uniref:phage integrase N-terminal domain-containing protein n=1 Tax=Burkholderia TaxID=32008 RepID=UPI00163ED9B2|nr:MULTISPECIES: phage integrase N-terminal domain-containing protein [Burkholderia]UVS94939.1 integrase [Burkholderia glumae]